MQTTRIAETNQEVSHGQHSAGPGARVRQLKLYGDADLEPSRRLI